MCQKCEKNEREAFVQQMRLYFTDDFKQNSGHVFIQMDRMSASAQRSKQCARETFLGVCRRAHGRQACGVGSSATSAQEDWEKSPSVKTLRRTSWQRQTIERKRRQWLRMAQPCGELMSHSPMHWGPPRQRKVRMRVLEKVLPHSCRGLFSLRRHGRSYRRQTHGR